MNNRHPSCEECCTCDPPTLLVAISSASRSKHGLPDYTCTGRFFLGWSISGHKNNRASSFDCPADFAHSTYSGSGTLDYFGAVVSDDTQIEASWKLLSFLEGCSGSHVLCEGSITVPGGIGNICTSPSILARSIICGGSFAYVTPPEDDITKTATSLHWHPSLTADADHDIDVTITLSDEFTTGLLETVTQAALPEFPDLGVGGPEIASRHLSYEETSYSVEKGKYVFRFRVPKMGTGKCYKTTWAERFIPGLTYDSDGVVTGGGTSIDSVEVEYGGEGRWPASGSTSLMTDGTVQGIALANGGNGYTSAPGVILSAPETPGGATATATAIVADGVVTGLTLTGAGSGYKEPPLVTFHAPSGGATPTIEFTAPGSDGTTATGTVTLADDGSIASVALTSGGTRYLGEPGVSITSAIGLGRNARLKLHLGTEEAKTYTWDGTVPSGYDPSDPTTYPNTGEYTRDFPDSNGDVYVVHIQGQCRGCS